MGARVFERMATELAVPPWDEEVGAHPSHAERIILAEKIASLFEGNAAESDLEILAKQLPSLLEPSTDLP
jgi:hypothetical protein